MSLAIFNQLTNLWEDFKAPFLLFIFLFFYVEGYVLPNQLPSHAPEKTS